MRYLPTIEIGHQIYQFALPDVHAVSLAECLLIQSAAEPTDSLESLLLASPMLLLWLSVKVDQDEAIRQPIAFHEDSWLDHLVQRLKLEGPCLVRDNFKPLSSVVRIEAEQFLETYCFFQIRDETGKGIARRLIDRLFVLQHGLAPVIGQRTMPHPDLNPGDFAFQQLVTQFEQTDFGPLPDREQIFRHWHQEIPVFRNGLGSLENILSRLHILETEFEAAVEREKISAIQQLAYGASHEINNPLANISTRAQALLRDETDPKRRQRLQTIDAQAFRAHDMISNLMTFAKPRRPEIQRFQLRPIAERAVESLVAPAAEQQIEIRLEVDSGVYLEADVEHVREMIFALVQNALESIRQQGVVRVRCVAPESGQPIRLEILDDGPGISPEVRRHIFDPFFSGREAGRGLGFGMSKVWRLMELHEGTVQVRDQLGLTCIELLFPAKSPLNQRLDIEKTA